MNSYYNEEELLSFGFKNIGNDVKISRKASIYSPSNIEIGNNVRIDDFCILSGNISIGNNIHISAYSALYGGGSIILEDYSGVSPRCTLISASDDFSGDYMIGAVIDSKFTNVKRGTIHLEKYVQLGAGTIVLPDVTISEGSVCGAMSLVNKNLDSWGIYYGIPVKRMKDRSKRLLDLVADYEKK